MSTNTLIRDLSGRPIGYLDGDVVRDDAGKALATRAGNDKQTLSFADKAAAMMTGRQVLMDLGQADVLTPATQASFGIPGDLDFIADQVSEIRYISRDRGAFYVESVNDALKLVISNESGDGGPAEVTPSYAKTSFTTTGYAVAAQIPRLLSSNTDWDLLGHTLRFLVTALRRQREFRIATLLTTSTNWNANNVTALGATAKWNGGTTADPLAAIYSSRQNSILPVTSLILPEPVEQYFFAPTGATTTPPAGISRVQQFVQGGGELPKVLVGRAKYSSGSSGVTPVYIWAPAVPSTAILIRSTADIPTCVTFRWLGDSGNNDGEMREGVLVRQFFDPTSDSNWIVVAHNDAEAFVSNQVGSLITGAIA
jgi:hypothetical protein